MSDRFLVDPELRQRIAGSSPNHLLKELAFWRYQPAFLAVVVFSLVFIRFLLPYTYRPAGGWEYLTVAVQALAIWGAAITARALAAIDVESAIVTEAERRATEYLRDLKSGRRPRVDLNELDEMILPNNPSDPPPAMIRLFQHICKEAKDRKFESSLNLIQPYREEPLEEIFKLQNVQKIALWLGILGTFVGLLLAIGEVDLSNLGSEESFAQLVHTMFSGLVVAFSASLAGLEVAVIIGFFILLLRRRQDEYFQKMESAVVTMLSLARNAINKDEFLAELTEVTTVLHKLGDRINDQTREVSAQSNEIRKGLRKLAEAGQRFDGFLNGLAETEREFIAEIRSVYDVLSLKNLAATLQTSVADAGKEMSATLAGGAKDISARLAEFNDSMSQVTGVLQVQSRESAEGIKRLANQLSASTAESANTVKTMIREFQDAIQREGNTVNSVRKELNDLSLSLRDLDRSLQRRGHAGPPPKRSIRDLLASLRW